MPGTDASDLSDGALLRASAAGDPEAFETFVDRYEAAVYRYVRTVAGDGDRVDDVVQETFIAAWRGARGFRGTDNGRAWLFRIARNAAYRQHRRRAGAPAVTVPLDELALSAGWGDDAAESFAERLQAREVVERGLAALDAEDREILVLRDLDGMSGEDAAMTLGISLAAGKSRLHRARLRFMASVKGLL